MPRANNSRNSNTIINTTITNNTINNNHTLGIISDTMPPNSASISISSYNHRFIITLLLPPPPLRPPIINRRTYIPPTRLMPIRKTNNSNNLAPLTISNIITMLVHR